jgi:23S rRNA (cytosine1962-C5)-methyltransferase
MPSDLVNSLPVPSSRRLAVRLTPDALRQVRGGHPWVYDASITSVTEGGQAGDLAVVFDDNRRFAAIGLYDPNSPIRLKILHVGRPVTIDTDWWRTRIATALARRDPLRDSGHTTGYRCIHGENDGFGGLVLDRYADSYVLKLYSEAWFPHLRTLVPLFAELLNPRSVVLRLSRRVASEGTPIAEGTALIGSVPAQRVRFLEHGLAFEADVAEGQKTGHFLDQRDNRALIGTMAKGTHVLDVFSSSGGFTVHAAAGGAASVHSIDMSPASIQLARHHMSINSDRALVKACRHETTIGDAFDAMDDLVRKRQRFGIVIIDPPSFAQRQSSVAGGLQAYRRLTALGLSLVQPGGILLQASCSSRITADRFFDAIVTVANSRGDELEEIAQTGHALDHPIGFTEGAYLKAMIARVNPG